MLAKTDHDQRRVDFSYRRYRSGKTAVPAWPLAILIISFFYCLPLGRFSIGGFDSDFRIFDFIILFVIVFYLSHSQVTAEFAVLWRSDRWFLGWIKILVILIIASVLISVFYSGTSYLLPRLIRLYRFLSYLLLPFLVLSVVRNKETYLGLFKLYFWLIAIVGLIAFLQGLNLLPNFWPDYWQVMYGDGDAPVATLSPHHKHIGVMMLVGVCLSIGYWLRTKSWIMKSVIAVICVIMFSVPLFTGTRTYLLGFVGVLPAMLLVGNIRIVIPVVLMVIVSVLFLQYTGDAITAKIERKFDERVTGRIERLGYEGLYRERTVIYWDIWDAIVRQPYILVTGVGYQNIRSFVAANGAHNNFLQVLMELGIVGLGAFLMMFAKLWSNLRKVITTVGDRDVNVIARYSWVVLCGVLMTMLVGETFWGQAAMFTLAGQLSFLFGLAVSPLYWLNRYFSEYR